LNITGGLKNGKKSDYDERTGKRDERRFASFFAVILWRDVD
jgi:hypothetical protein